MKISCATGCLSILVICVAAMAAANPPATNPAPPAPGPVTGPAGAKNELGLTAAIVVNKSSYVLDPAQSGKEFRDRITGAGNPRGRGMGGGRLPQPPAVDLVLRITNTTDKDVTITTGGDDSQMNLKLEGEGAVTVDNNVAMTMEFRIGRPLPIAAGKSIDVKITSLAFGMRGVSKHAYWTEAGEHTVTATLTYGTPMGDRQGTVTSGPVKVKVTKD